MSMSKIPLDPATVIVSVDPGKVTNRASAGVMVEAVSSGGDDGLAAGQQVGDVVGVGGWRCVDEQLFMFAAAAS